MKNDSNMLKKITVVERRFACRLLRTAVRQAEKSGDVMSNQSKLWKLVVLASHKPKR